jgi:parallel beta-helix repeat protein
MILVSVAAVPATATAGRVTVTSTIQAAVDSAAPGDVVLVPPGRYHESVTVTKSDVTIRGSRGAVLDASGSAVGIRASSGPNGRGDDGFPVCPEPRLHDLAIEGLRIEHASFTGVLFRGVTNFRISHGVYTGGSYSIFPVCSRDGRIDHNQAGGTTDGAIYVGNSRNVAITDNVVKDATIGIEIENSTSITVQDNLATANSSGIVAFVLPGLPIPRTEDVVITRNVVSHNNLPNPVAPDAGAQGLIPTGTGILASATDHVAIHSNRVVGNDSGGIALLANPLVTVDPRADSAPDGNEIRDNVVLDNGRSPDQSRSPLPGADLIYDGSGTDNCFAGNRYQTEFPTGVSGAFACSQ